MQCQVTDGPSSRLEKLWWLDIRGGSAINLEVVRGAANLQYLAVNQVRGMRDLSVVLEMIGLRYISLYGLPQVTQLPPFLELAKLEHADLGQMRGLRSLDGLLAAPRLRELQLIKKINVSAKDADGIINHPTIKFFTWYAFDVPIKVWQPVVEKIKLPPVPPGHPEDWFGIDGFSTGCNGH